MTHEDRIVDERRLENGLTAYFYDMSRPVAGDRFQVQLKLHIPVEVREEYFRNCAAPRKDYEDFTAAFGPYISFEQEKVRNFVDVNMVGHVLHEMKEDMLKSNLVYLSKPTFAEKYVSKVFAEWKKAEALQKAQQAALRGL